MYCANCGEIVTGGAQFCTECGAKMPAAKIRPEPPPSDRRLVDHVPDVIVGTVVSVLSALLFATDSRYAYYDSGNGVFGFIRFIPLPLGPPISEFLYVLSSRLSDSYKSADYFVATVWPSAFALGYHVA